MSRKSLTVNKRLTYDDLLMPPNLSDNELRVRLKAAVENRVQADAFINAVTDELVRRGKSF